MKSSRPRRDGIIIENGDNELRGIVAARVAWRP